MARRTSIKFHACMVSEPLGCIQKIVRLTQLKAQTLDGVFSQFTWHHHRINLCLLYFWSQIPYVVNNLGYTHAIRGTLYFDMQFNSQNDRPCTDSSRRWRQCKEPMFFSSFVWSLISAVSLIHLMRSLTSCRDYLSCLDGLLRLRSQLNISYSLVDLVVRLLSSITG